MRRVLSMVAIALGVGCLATAGFLFWNNQQEEQQAQTSSAYVSQALQQSIQQSVQPQTESVTKEGSTTAPFMEVDGASYIGILSIPQLELELPIANVYSYDTLNQTPCVYTGAIAQNNLVIAAHNYKAHFGTIHQLNIGDTITLLDALGVVHTYIVTGQETIDDNNVSGLYAGDWDLTLFTCLYRDNSQRVVIRLSSVAEHHI